MASSNLAAKLSSTSAAIATAEQGNIASNEKNKSKANELLELMEKAKGQQVEDIQDPKVRAQMAKVDNEVRRSKRRWRTVKDVLSGVIVGSGIEWARDEALIQFVLDEEE